MTQADMFRDQTVERPVYPESRAFYAAVVWLRSKGLKVCRISGRQSRVGDHLFTKPEVVRYAVARGWVRA